MPSFSLKSGPITSAITADPYSAFVKTAALRRRRVRDQHRNDSRAAPAVQNHDHRSVAIQDRSKTAPARDSARIGRASAPRFAPKARAPRWMATPSSTCMRANVRRSSALIIAVEPAGA